MSERLCSEFFRDVGLIVAADERVVEHKMELCSGPSTQRVVDVSFPFVKLPLHYEMQAGGRGAGGKGAEQGGGTEGAAPIGS